jgi:hypothetical protein
MAITRYAPVGRCIYCGTDRYSENSIELLHLEHIIPYALNGPWNCQKQVARAASASPEELNG